MTDKITRTLGYTELWERMRRVLAVEGEVTHCGWLESEPPPAYFSEDGQPEMLFGYVLEGLGVTPEQVVADLLPHNESEPGEIFAAAGFPLTTVACSRAEGAWLYEMRSVYWSRCIGELDAYGPEHRRWLPQDVVTLAEIEGTAGQPNPVDVTAITATFPATPPPELADAWDCQIGYEVWMQAAEKAGEGTTWTVDRFTFDLDSAPVDTSSSDANAYGAILTNYRWYVLERHGDTIRARLVPID